MPMKFLFIQSGLFFNSDLIHHIECLRKSLYFQERQLT
eukprot:UN02820